VLLHFTLILKGRYLIFELNDLQSLLVSKGLCLCALLVKVFTVLLVFWGQNWILLFCWLLKFKLTLNGFQLLLQFLQDFFQGSRFFFCCRSQAELSKFTVALLSSSLELSVILLSSGVYSGHLFATWVNLPSIWIAITATLWGLVTAFSRAGYPCHQV